MRLALVAIASLAAGPAFAQTAATPTPRAYELAPWWMDKPVIPSIGQVWTEVPSNRASIDAVYQVVDRDVGAATKAAADKVRALGQALEAYGAERVRIATTFEITPLYAQYRDKQGELNDNERADKIERYQVSANVSVEIRDVRLTERVYATMMSAKPSSADDVRFRLEVENETRTQMARLAVEDARRRAQLSAEAAGTRLGPVRLIDPTSRACEADVLLAGANRAFAGAPAYRVAAPAPPAAPGGELDEIVTTARKRAADVGLNPDDIRMPLQPPLQRIEERACVVFGLG